MQDAGRPRRRAPFHLPGRQTIILGASQRSSCMHREVGPRSLAASISVGCNPVPAIMLGTAAVWDACLPASSGPTCVGELHQSVRHLGIKRMLGRLG